MRLLLVVLSSLSLHGGTPAVRTIAGTLSANTGATITVTSADRSLTCAVPGERAQAVILRWGTGARVRIACRTRGDGLVLWRLIRLGVRDPGTGAPTKDDPGAETTTTDETRTEPTTTEPATTTTASTGPTAPDQPRRDARGVVTVLTGDGVALQPDAGAELVKCAITPAPDSQTAAAKLSVGAHAGIVCRLDGGRWILSGATLIS